ncbi:MAG: aminotransferase class V-fold PLP-dependent enzyme [Deltaproteobacteria bacterium]|nr:aminotransferase class V-fold PLP-dependent enzyme [Deltaproteobacteria bacterium]
MLDQETIRDIRKDFPALNNTRNGMPPIYFDNACTTLTPEPVIKSMDEYYMDFPGCGGRRSRHWFADETYMRIEGKPEKEIKGSRSIFKEFINAGNESEIIFTQNATHGINIVALGFNFRSGDIVLLTDLEHNSNLLPWQRLRRKSLIQLKFTESDENGCFELDKYKSMLEQDKVRLVSMAYTFNLTGYTIPAKEIIRLAHQHGARVLLDAAQTAPYQSIDVQDLDVDFLVFSVHKMCGPRGVGILYGKRELLGSNSSEEEAEDVIEPALLGGGSVGDSTYDSYYLLDPPERFETGIQNYPGQIAAGEAVKYIQRIGLNHIYTYVNSLNQFLTDELLHHFGHTGWFTLFGPKDPSMRGGILAFDIKRPNAPGIAEDLSERSNIMIRDGGFCVHSFINKQFGEGWMLPSPPSEHRMIYRISLYFYNTIEECEIFLEELTNVFRERCYI